MPLFDVAPIIIEMFPILVSLPMLLTMIGGKFLQRRTPTQHDVSKSMDKIKWAILGPFVIIVSMLLISLLLAVIFQTPQTEYLFIFSYTVLQGAISIAIGCFAGIALLGGYETLGVSAFLLIASIFIVIPLITIYTGTASSAIGISVSTFSFLSIMALFQSQCCERFSKRLLHRYSNPTEKAEVTLLQGFGRKYIRETVDKLTRRIEHDDDQIAKEALHQFQETEGELGVYIKKVIEEDILNASHIHALDSTTFSSGRRIMERAVKPSGSWTMVNDEFNRKVRRNQVLYFIFLIPLLVLAYYSTHDLSLVESQWVLLLSMGIIVPSIPLAVFDRLFLGRRLNVEEVLKAAKGPLLGIDIEEFESDFQPP